VLDCGICRESSISDAVAGRRTLEKNSKTKTVRSADLTTLAFTVKAHGMKMKRKACRSGGRRVDPDVSRTGVGGIADTFPNHIYDFSGFVFGAPLIA
jgi:hypothetical protein